MRWIVRPHAVRQQAGDREALAVGEADGGLALPRGQAGDREPADGHRARRIDVADLGLQLEVQRPVGDDGGREVQDDAELLPLHRHGARDPVDIGIGNSPPTRNFASWPDSATSVGSASILASPLDSSAVRIALNGKFGSPEKNSEKPPPTRGAWTGGLPGAPGPGNLRRTVGRHRRRGHPADEPAAGVLVEDVEAQLAQPGARHLGELHLQLHLLVADDLDQVRDLVGVKLRRPRRRARERARRRPRPTARPDRPPPTPRSSRSGRTRAAASAGDRGCASPAARCTSASSRLFHSVRSVVADAARGEQQLRRRDHLEVGDLRIGDRDAPDRLGQQQQPVLSGLERQVLDRAHLAIDADRGRAGGVLRRAASAGLRWTALPETMRLPPAGAASLSLVSSVEVALLEAIAAQDLDGVLLRRRLGRQRRRRRRPALAAAPRRDAPAWCAGALPGEPVLLRDRAAADQARTGWRRWCRPAGSRSSSATSA